MPAFDIDALWPHVAPHAAAGRRPSSNAEPDSAAAPETHVAGVAARVMHRARALLPPFDATAAFYAALGFLAGALAWHAIGFWAFVGDVVLHRDANGKSATWVIARQADALRPSPITTGALQASAPKAIEPCVALTIDRSSGATAPSACRGDSAVLRDGGFTRTGDRLGGVVAAPDHDANAWAPSTGLASPNVAGSEDVGTLSPADVNLEISATP